MQRYNKQVMQVGLIIAIAGFGFPQVGQTSRKVENKPVYKRSLSALRNIIDVRDELEERLEDLVDEERKIGDEKKELRMVVKDIDGVFPKGKENLTVRARGFARRLRDIEREQNFGLERNQVVMPINQHPVVKQKSSNSGVVVGVIVGALVSVAAGFFFWKVVGKKSKKKVCNNNDAVFIRSLTSYVEGVR